MGEAQTGRPDPLPEVHVAILEQAEVTAEELIAFEAEVADAFEAGHIRAPVHISGGNEAQLIEIFKDIRPSDWVISTYRSHYHALLHGIPREKVMAAIMSGHSMNLSFPEHRFLTSAIVGGTLPIAVGIAAALKRKESEQRVWCFCGDMAASTGAFHEATEYSSLQNLPVRFWIEANGMSCDSPIEECWGNEGGAAIFNGYQYKRTYPHVGTGKFVSFV